MRPPRLASMKMFLPTLVTLLAALSGVGADPADPCKQPPPTITAATATKSSFRNYKDLVYLDTTYGEDVIVSCSSSDTANLASRSELHLQAERLNSTTLQLTVKKPNVGRHEYFCTDSNSGCSDTLLVSVEPVITVTAPGVLHKLVYSVHEYFVPGLPGIYNISCSGNAADVSIIVELDRWRKLETKAVNETTVTATVTDTTGRRYYCEDSKGIAKMDPIRVIVDHYPEAREFRCVLHQARALECAWRSLSKRHTFELFYMDTHEIVHLCSDKSGNADGGCATAWEGGVVDYEYESEFTVLLQTCVKVFCHVKTFRMPLGSIKKLDPVYNLQLLNSTSLGATVAWLQGVPFGDCAYKVEYRMLGIEWRPVNVSGARCADTCELPLALPCADAHYELRVYVRYKQATEDRFWSEPSSTFFFTAPSSGDVGSACDEEFREQEPPPSAEVALYKVRELISDERKETKALKKKVDALRNKLAKVKALMDSRTESGLSASGPEGP